MYKKIILLFVLIFLINAMVLAHEGEEIAEGEALVIAKVSCDSLSADQLEAVGEWYMEQMHPGALHDAMHEAMGLEEGTEEHKQFHITLAQRMYCGENVSFKGMMGGYGMMWYGMMGMMYGNLGWSSLGLFWLFLLVIFLAVVFALVFWSVFKVLEKKRRQRK